MGRRGPRAQPSAAFAAARRSRYWREEDARAVLAVYRASGQPLQTFCRAHGVGVHRLRWWRERLPREEAVPESAPQFVPVHVRPSGGAAPLEVVLPRGPVIRVAADFDGAVLRRLLAVLAEAPC